MFNAGIGNYGSPMSFRNMGTMPGMGGAMGWLQGAGSPQSFLAGLRAPQNPSQGMGGAPSGPYNAMLMQHLQQQMGAGGPQGMAQAMGRQMIPGMGQMPPQDAQARPMGVPAPMGQPMPWQAEDGPGAGVLGAPGMGMPASMGSQPQAPGQLTMPSGPPSVAGMSPSDPKALAQGVGRQMIPGMGKPMGVGGGAQQIPQGGVRAAVMPQDGAQMPAYRPMGRM